MARKVFHGLNGYRDVGRRDDIDFTLRAILAGCKEVYCGCSISPISNER